MSVIEEDMYRANDSILYFMQSQGLYGYGKVITHLLTQPVNKSTEVYRYAINDLTGHQRAADALTKYVRK